MVNNSNNTTNQEDGGKNPSGISRGIGGGGGAAKSWGTTGSGQSVSTSGSVGSPSSRSETAAATPASDNTFLRLNNLDIQGDDAGSQGATGNKKKKRGQRAAGGDKSGRGLRQFSMKVCEKVESKGRTTYNEVADELVTEFADPNNNIASPDQQQYDEKNIRRRVYDALNVLMAMDIISKDKKEIQWKGLPRTSLNDIEELKNESLGIRNRIEKKAAYLQELEEQVFKNLSNVMSNYMAWEMLLVVVWLYLLYWCRLVLMQQWRWKYQKICSWCISILIAPHLSYTMTIMFSRQ
ncbi:transcription factor-like protein DPB isoform X3 [Olea europaea var. sylvestris]|uniref:transcription factor-like protein DPB isoform X3 n=1 Tax=Olea europaea var. sylvestris TaxID=158386 RepID=UPI000C1D39D2|nr:transcription factor-like protein DPB isoform X3 [Olea europaea var. sylvestris]